MQQPPTSDSLPSHRTLAWAAAAVLALATLLGVGVVLPAETGRDPLGIGAMIGLTEMGRIKVALAEEARSNDTAGLVAEPAAETVSAPRGQTAVIPTGDAWRDSMTVTLAPNKGIELKLDMRKDDKAFYSWTADADEIYFNRHGEPPDAPKDFPAHSYAKGMAREDQGELVAVFDGMHGWFWRNRSEKSATITLRTRGQYRVLKQL